MTVKGYSIHPGSAKDKMRNSQTIAMEFDRLLPAAERPQYTEGYEGFYHMTDIHGGVEETHCTYILRDHDSDKLAARGETMQKAAAFLNERYGEGTVTVEITHTYRNMKEKILPVYEVITVAEEAIRTAGLTPVTVPIRGGHRWRYPELYGSALPRTWAPVAAMPTGGMSAIPRRIWSSACRSCWRSSRATLPCKPRGRHFSRQPAGHRYDLPV